MTTPLIFDLGNASTSPSDVSMTVTSTPEVDESLSEAGPFQSAFNVLCECFPNSDREVLQMIIEHHSGNVETAAVTVLEMEGGSNRQHEQDGPAIPIVEDSRTKLDEEIAMALFKQFAEELGDSIPESVREDPARYEDHVQHEYDAWLQRNHESVWKSAGSSLRNMYVRACLLLARSSDTKC